MGQEPDAVPGMHAPLSMASSSSASAESIRERERDSLRCERRKNEGDSCQEAGARARGVVTSDIRVSPLTAGYTKLVKAVQSYLKKA